MYHIPGDYLPNQEELGLIAKFKKAQDDIEVGDIIYC